ncbi:hypothetical protein FIBSPDRAFT_353670 [Athelia psychrophila]|uniref:Uncharacterized protein n=1 Tax=Athelia psychrophila TaxID=1759441 RepID=A0A166PRF9_9AGAM|nr:hypothetical protein FIBSPDRAFT_353670 [Fibularhizoctonia sp. CBS 109695]
MARPILSNSMGMQHFCSMAYSSGPSTFFLPPQSMSFHNANANAGESSMSALTPSTPRLNLAPVTFTVHNASGRSRITNVNGDSITTNNISYVRCYCMARDGDRDETRCRCAHRTGAAEEEGREALALALALALILSLALALAKHRAEAQAEHDRDDQRNPQQTPAAAAAAVSIQFNLALGGPSCEGQIVISYRVVAVSTGAFFFCSEGNRTVRSHFGKSVIYASFSAMPRQHHP